MNYEEFLKSKQFKVSFKSVDIQRDELNDSLFEYQKDLVYLALRKGHFALFAMTGSGKEQPYSEPVLTPSGFVNMGDLKLSDYVIGKDGKKAKITDIFEQGIKDVYKISFNDGTFTHCGLNHLWNVRTREEKRKNLPFKTVDIKEIMKNYKSNIVDKRNGKTYNNYKYHIPINEEVEFNESNLKLPLDPYLLGVLIGDGGLSGVGVRITNQNDNLIEKISLLLPIGDKINIKENDITHSIVNKNVSNQPSATKIHLINLGLHGKKSIDKHIPKEYLMSSLKSRKSLLQGLLDTDGHIVSSGINEYSTSSIKLCKDITFLARSLGYVVQVKSRKSKYTKNGITKTLDNLNYRVYIKDMSKTKKLKTITNIELIRKEKSRCITVDNKDHLYITNDFIVTHNTAMQIEWAYQVWKKEQKPILVLTPLAVAHQTVDEAKKILGYDVKFVTTQEECENGINITNYEKLDHFNADEFIAIVLDESSILKSFTGKIRDKIIGDFQSTPYKLACSATPAPNDHMELGNHSEFLNVMSRTEMLAMFFVHDGGETSKWRLKGHARDKFWEFVSGWSAVFTKPSDIGYSKEEDKKFSLPKKTTIEHIVHSKPTNALFATHAETLQERRQAKRDSLLDRCQIVADLVNSSDDIWLVWCELNDESALLKKLINDSVEVKGSDKDEHKTKSMHDFADGKIKCLVTKPKIAGFGMNWQVCHNVAFASVSDSFEQFFQSERRVYRYGQKHDVNVHIVASEAEGSIKNNLKRKEKDFIQMINEIVSHTKAQTLKEIKQVTIDKTEYNPQVVMSIPKFLKVS